MYENFIAIFLVRRPTVSSVRSAQISAERSVKLSSLGAARVTRLPLAGAARGQSWRAGEALTLVSPRLEALDSGAVPLWVIIVAAVAGALLLLLLILLLYKVRRLKRSSTLIHFVLNVIEVVLRILKSKDVVELL